MHCSLHKSAIGISSCLSKENTNLTKAFDLHQACVRELEEETGISGVELKQFETFGAVDRDPRGRTISVVFYALIKEQLKAKGSDDAARAVWFPVEDLPQLAFDHQQIISKLVDFCGIKISTP